MLFWHWYFKERKSVYLAFLRWEKYQWKYFQSMVIGQVKRKELNVAQSNNRQKRFLLQFLLCSQTFLEMHKEPNTSITITRTVSTYDQIQPKKGNILLSDCNLTCVDLHKWEKFFVGALFIILPHYNVTFPLDDFDFLTSSSFNQSWLTQIHKKILSGLQKAPFFGCNRIRK